MVDTPRAPDGRNAKKPRNQTDEKHGSVTGQQVSGHTTRHKDLPRGSEGEARRRSGMSR